MKKTLILMRHAKAAPYVADQLDHDRPLAPRGLRNATALGKWLQARDHLPEVALVSSAQRTRETYQALGLSAELGIMPALYNAGPADYLALLADQVATHVLIVGHNPTIAAVGDHLLRGSEIPVELSAYPTGATLVIHFDDQSWAEAIRRPGTLADWTIPRALDP